MTNKHYQPLDAMVYPRFSGIRTFMRLPHLVDLVNITTLQQKTPLSG